MLMLQNLGAGVSLHDFAPISSLGVGCSVIGTLGVDFADSTQPVNFDIVIESAGTHKVSFQAPVGEILRAVTMPEDLFVSQQGKYHSWIPQVTTKR